MKSLIKTVCATLVVAVVASVAMAADKPNFTGEWKINAAKSNFGPYPSPTSYTRKVTHSEPTLTIVDEMIGGFGEPRSTRTYTIDGKAITYQAMGAEITAAATWETNAVVINARGVAASPIGEATFEFTDTWTLSEEGRTLMQAIHVETPQGPLDLSYVFDRQ